MMKRIENADDFRKFMAAILAADVGERLNAIARAMPNSEVIDVVIDFIDENIAEVRAEGDEEAGDIVALSLKIRSHLVICKVFNESWDRGIADADAYVKKYRTEKPKDQNEMSNNRAINDLARAMGSQQA